MPAHVVRGAAASTRELRGGWGTEIQYVGPDTGAGAVSVRVYRLRAGLGHGPFHMHTNSESVYFVLAGTIGVRLDAAEHVLEPGDLAFIPPGTPHSVRNSGRDEASFIELYAPAEADFVVLDP